MFNYFDNLFNYIRITFRHLILIFKFKFKQIEQAMFRIE